MFLLHQIAKEPEIAAWDRETRKLCRLSFWVYTKPFQIDQRRLVNHSLNQTWMVISWLWYLFSEHNCTRPWLRLVFFRWASEKLSPKGIINSCNQNDTTFSSHSRGRYLHGLSSVVAICGGKVYWRPGKSHRIWQSQMWSSRKEWLHDRHAGLSHVCMGLNLCWYRAFLHLFRTWQSDCDGNPHSIHWVDTCPLYRRARLGLVGRVLMSAL
jgi:hypothetical protein